MDRATLEITLPNCKARLVVYERLTNWQFRQLTKASIGDYAVDVDMKTRKMNELTNMQFKVATELDLQDMAVEFLLKEAYLSDGSKVENLVEFYHDIDPEDGQYFIEEVNKITGKSQLSAEDKKK